MRCLAASAEVRLAESACFAAARGRVSRCGLQRRARRAGSRADRRGALIGARVLTTSLWSAQTGQDK